MSQDLDQTTFKLVETYFSSLDCPRSLTTYLLFTNNEYEQLVNLDCNPKDYGCTEDFRLAYLATKFLSKNRFLSTKIDKEAEALKKFQESEYACKEINKRGFHWKVIKDLSNEWLHNAIIQKIWHTLGDFDGDELFDLSNWGPGVSLDVKGADTSPTNKFRKDFGTTRPFDDFISQFYALAYPTWDLSNRKFHVGNRVITVPKNSKVDRTIAIEPGLNLWFQKGVGQMIRRRLLRRNLDLNSQDRNQRLSRLGSKFNHLATVDFSSASDTISIATVEALLPPQWFCIMDLMRSRYGLVKGIQFRYEKFSSMGNGFSFELESLIFWSIAVSVCEYLHISSKNVSVYGDDVIIPVEAFDLYVRTCAFYGFTVNVQKSFSDGNFRESCGAHWYLGMDCKPYFLKELVKSEAVIYRVANGIRRISHNSEMRYCDIRFYPVWRFLCRQVRKPLFTSNGYGDGGFIENFDIAKPQRCKFGIEGYLTLALITIPLGYTSDDHPILLARLKGRSSEMSMGNLTYLRGRVKSYRKRLFVPRWYNLGDWI